MPPNPRTVLVVTGFYTAALTAVALVRGSRELPLYLGLMAVLVPLIWLVHRKQPLTRSLMWAFSAWGFLHMAGGLWPEPPHGFQPGDDSLLYNWWLIPGRLRYDHVVHAFGFGTCAWFCWHLLSQSLKRSDGTPLRPTAGVLAVCVGFGLGLGALNETVEFITTRLRPGTNIGDFENTGWDLVANLAGALVAVAIIRWRHRR
jgi:uncharacterized membrane protein YjdF